MPTKKYDTKVSKFIDAFWSTNYRSPVIREVMKACGINSTSLTRYVLRKVAAERGDTVCDVKYARMTIAPKWVVTAIQNATKARRARIARARARKFSGGTRTTRR